MQTRRCIGWVTGSAALLALFVPGYPAIGQSGPPASSRTGVGLGEFWPANSPSRDWELVPRRRAGDPNAPVSLSIENQTIGPGRFILWFYNPRRLRLGQRNGEEYRICRLPNETWLYLDSYLNAFQGRIMHTHPVESDRILVTRADGKVSDLIQDGEYRACGAHGQPYLLWSGAPWHYRIQVWGHLIKNRDRKWYWDATVSGPEAITNDCLTPVAPQTAVRVQEAWWSNPKNPSGAWRQGSGDTDPSTGMPTGTGVRYGRTVWHGSGGIPYYMTGPGSGPGVSPRQCVDRISAPKG
jgi:hypothetical protein